MSELVHAEDATLVLPSTGEIYDLAVPGEAARAWAAVRALEQDLARARRYAAQTLVEEAQRLGTKTLRIDGAPAFKITGGPTTTVDPQLLRDELRAAGCPEDRIEDAIKKTYSETVDRGVLRSLATNAAYKAAIERATTSHEGAYGVGLA